MPEKNQQDARDVNEAQAAEDAAQAAAAETATQDEEADLDETVEGGRYEVNGKIVDANGNEIKGEK